MNVPNKVRIAGIDFKIDKTKTKEQLEEIHNLSVLGAYNKEQQLIWVAKDTTEIVIQSTLIHEILHGIFEAYMPPIDYQLHEDYVTLISNGLFQVIKDNPKVASAIFGGESMKKEMNCKKCGKKMDSCSCKKDKTK